MWCSQLRFPSFAVTPNVRRPHTNASNGRAFCTMMDCARSFLFIQKMKKSTEFVIGQMRWEQLNFIMTESWIQFKNKENEEEKTNLNQFCALALCLMVLWWVRGKRRATFRIHVCISHSHRIRFDFVPAIHMKIEVCFAERLLHSMHSNRIETIVRRSACATELSCKVLSTFQINWAVRKFADNTWSRRCGNQKIQIKAAAKKKKTKPNAIRSNLVTFGVPA